MTLPDTAGPLTIPADGSGSGLLDSLLPWLVNVDVFMTATNTNWATFVNDVNHLYTFYRQSSGAQNDQVSFDVVLAAGTWTFELIYDTGGGAGIFTVLLDNVSQGTIDAYGASVNNVRSQITGIAIATAGKKTLALKMATKNASSTNYYGQITHLQFKRTA